MLRDGVQVFAQALNDLVALLVSLGFNADVAANLATDGFVITMATAVISIAISIFSKWKVRQRRAEVNERLWRKLFLILEKHRLNIKRIPQALHGMTKLRNRPEENAFKVGYTAATFTHLKSAADELLTEFAALPIIVGAASPHAGDGVLEFVEHEFSALNLLAIQYKSFSESADHFLRKHNKAEKLIFDHLEYDCGWMHGFANRIELDLARSLSQRPRVMAWIRSEGLKGDFESPV